MPHKNREVARLLQGLDLGSSVAETDSLLEIARIETSAFTDLSNDRVDLIPGTKGSGKSALFRIFVEFLPNALLGHRRVVVAHGVQAPGDPVFHAFAAQFSRLSEDDFTAFWCIYLVSLANEQFLKCPRFADLLASSKQEVQCFREACVKAGIPEVAAKKSLRDILAWSLEVLRQLPTLKYKLPNEGGELSLDLFGRTISPPADYDGGSEPARLPRYLNSIKESLEQVLTKSDLSLWLMIDRLDEIFPRRSDVEKHALRGLLRTLRYFSSNRVRLKIFLRDDMLDQIVNSGEGFTALTHVTVRQSDTLRWTTEQIEAMIVKRFFANESLATYFRVDQRRIDASASYRTECFKKVFPPTVFRGSKQSSTLAWIYNRCADGRGVVTPRDILDLLIRAKQRQEDMCASDPEETADWLIGSVAIQYGFEELSKRKRTTYLQAGLDPVSWTPQGSFWRRSRWQTNRSGTPRSSRDKWSSWHAAGAPRHRWRRSSAPHHGRSRCGLSRTLATAARAMAA